MYNSHQHNNDIEKINIFYNNFRLIGILKVFTHIHFAKICHFEYVWLKYECPNHQPDANIASFNIFNNNFGPLLKLKLFVPLQSAEICHFLKND